MVSRTQRVWSASYEPGVLAFLYRCVAFVGGDLGPARLHPAWCPIVAILMGF